MYDPSNGIAAETNQPCSVLSKYNSPWIENNLEVTGKIAD
jgi:hypothetical protein